MSKEIIKTNNDTQIPVTFKPRARLLLQLGDQLIKNESIALIELVKNSYDADANVVDITMEKVDDTEDGYILIKDDGYGMSSDIVENVWLEPGSDFKTQKIKQLETSPIHSRLPIGEKGIGRFGVHKLGNVVEMTTKTSTTNEVYVKIDWREFDKYKYLRDVPIIITERNTPLIFTNGATGTNILISKLRKPWERGVAREVRRSITALASPFEKSNSFKPSLTILDKPNWFEGLLSWQDITNYALFKFRVVIKGQSITEFKYEFVPWSTMTKLKAKIVTEENSTIKTFKTIKYLENYADSDKVGKTIDLCKYEIGAVTFEGYIFDRDAFLMKMGVADKQGFKQYLDKNGGVKVFRDTLRVYDYGEPENDWLGLDYRRFQQPAKRISNNIVLGAVSLNRKESYSLVEKTNREGFVENDAYEAFKNALMNVVLLIENLRDIDKRKIREIYGPTPKSSPVMSTLSEAKKYVEDNVDKSDVKAQIIKYFNKIEADYKVVTENLLKAAGAGLSMSVVVHEVEKVIYEVEKVLKSEKASERVLGLVTHLSSLIDGYAEIIRTSSKSSENIIQIVDQSLFNTEFRLKVHGVDFLKEYQKYKGTTKLKIAKNLLVGTIMNIIDNAIYWLDQRNFKAIEAKEDYQKKIYVNLVEDDKFVNLVIADNGIGFTLPTNDIIEPFVSDKPGGMGLGLHIANEIMESQKGQLRFPDYGDFEIPEEFKDGATVVLSFKK